ncbi:MAG: PhoPQ-activated pathogenicity [Acidobacteria bacterium]|nr:PhoPQ-activated pathogenicity [Acidobacteriota bacterium]
MLRLLFFAASAALLIAADSRKTALDRYVAAPDASYKYELIKTIPGEQVTSYVLELTSQEWKPPVGVDRTLWKHWVTIAKPAKVQHSTAFLFIGGGNNNSKPPERADASTWMIANNTGTVAVELRMVPNQPLAFEDEPGRNKVEDEIIAYTWDKFLKTGNEIWPLRLPMTKSAVRAMDAVTAFLASREGGEVKVDKFFVGGGSKRGWTTWTTAAVDPRVTGIVPFVIDLLNIVPSFVHHYRVYGGYAPAVKDYENKDIMPRSNTRQYRALMSIEEPFEYRDRLTMPKYIVNSAGDQFFVPDSSQFYFDQLKGEKYLRYVPNTDHSLRGSNAMEGAMAYYDALLNNRPRPKFSWKFEKDGTLRVECATEPTEVKLWRATNPEKRDFRLMTIGKAYTSETLQSAGKGVYTAKLAAPEKGWTAYFIELTFPSGGKLPFIFTTDVKVLPDVYPFVAPNYPSN